MRDRLRQRFQKENLVAKLHLLMQKLIDPQEIVCTIQLSNLKTKF